MKLGIMQPYFFPYIGYFSLIANVDKFIILDDVQFIRHGWIERNRILKPKEGWQYIAVPLQKHKQKVAISDIKINNMVDWKRKILSQLLHYKKAPFYNEVIALVEEIFAQEYESITELDIVALKKVSEYLGIDTEIVLFSKMNLKIEKVNDSDEWALNICKAMGGVKEYWNPPGGQSFFDKEKYKEAGIKLYFHNIDLIPYYQKNIQFERGLSIIDVMMFNSVKNIREMIGKFTLL